MPDAKPPILLVLGVTASGKSELALSLAERLPMGGELLAADSMQVYRGLDLGTAKPTSEERRRVPHHLLDLVEPHEGADPFTVADWRARAVETIDACCGRGRVPIVVGGTNLYVQALLKGLFEGPEPTADLRRELEATSTESLRAELERIDAVSAARIHLADRRRILRAVEVHRQTGVPMSQWQREWEANAESHLASRCVVIGVERPREVASRRINRRVVAMIEAGWLEEVRALLDRGLLNRQAIEAVGYRELVAVVAGRLSLADAVEQIKIRTRRYARQQRTWLKRFRARAGAIWLEAGERPGTELAEECLQVLLPRLHLATPP